MYNTLSYMFIAILYVVAKKLVYRIAWNYVWLAVKFQHWSTKHGCFFEHNAGSTRLFLFIWNEVNCLVHVYRMLNTPNLDHLGLISKNIEELNKITKLKYRGEGKKRFNMSFELSMSFSECGQKIESIHKGIYNSVNSICSTYSLVSLQHRIKYYMARWRNSHYYGTESLIWTYADIKLPFQYHKPHLQKNVIRTDIKRDTKFSF